MSYTLTTATTKIRELINESTEGFWLDSEIQGWIQEAVIDLSSKLLCVVSSDTITLVNSQYIYGASDESWIADCIKPKSVWYDGSSGPVGMQMISARQFGHTDMFDSEPKYYHYDSMLRQFFILPIPDATMVGETISVIYSYETDDITLLKDEYQPLTFLYAASKAKLKERMYQDSAFLLAQYTNLVNFERQDKYNLGIEPVSDFIVP